MTHTKMEQAVIDALKEREGGIYSREIASYAGIDKHKISGVIASLIQKGTISRDSFNAGEEYLQLND